MPHRSLNLLRTKISPLPSKQSPRQTIHFNVILPGIAVLRARPYLKFRFSPGKANLEYEARSRKGGGRSSFQERRMLRSGAMQQRQVKRIALNVVGGRNAGNAGRHICQLSPPPCPGVTSIHLAIRLRRSTPRAYCL